MFSFSSNFPKIRVLDIQGMITATKPSPLKKNVYRHYAVLQELHDMQSDDGTLGAVLRINSPGGTAGASAELAVEIAKLAQKKPVVASISDMACSGAYLAASQCTHIFASYMAMVGSIGAIMQLPDLRDVAKKIGADVRIFKSSEFKDIGNPLRDMSYDANMILDKVVKDSYTSFCGLVLDSRKGIKDEKTAFDGRVFGASDAVEIGLVDNVGTYFDALERILALVGKTEKEVEIEVDDDDGGFLGQLLGGVGLSSGLEELVASKLGFGLR